MSHRPCSLTSQFLSLLFLFTILEKSKFTVTGCQEWQQVFGGSDKWLWIEYGHRNYEEVSHWRLLLSFSQMLNQWAYHIQKPEGWILQLETAANGFPILLLLHLILESISLCPHGSHSLMRVENQVRGSVNFLVIMLFAPPSALCNTG